MLREIIFRGKRVDSSKWIFGNFLHPWNGVRYLANIHDGLYAYEVIPETVSQYTGLRDKNGVEVYEGDVLQFDDCGEEGYEYKEGFDFVNRAVVVFENGRFTLDKFLSTNSGVVEELNDHKELYTTIENSEVIGSIHDNPSLLEVQP